MGFFTYLGFLEIFIALTSFIILRRYSAARHNNLVLPVNYPVVGMLPEFLDTTLDLYDRLIKILEACNGSFLYKAPWFGFDLLLTVDPANVHYVLSKNFNNFEKGPKFREILEILGDSFLNSDGDKWREQRRMAKAVLSHDKFMRFSKLTNRDKLYDGLVPILDDLCASGSVFDLQDLLQRFTFDAMSILITGFDPKSLSGDFPDVPYAKAMNDAEEAIVYRLVLPARVWKLARWLNVGWERKLRIAWKSIDQITSNYISRKRKELAERDHDNNNEDNDNNVDRFDMLSWYIGSGIKDDKLLRGIILSFMTAGRDPTSSTLTWFFWAISKNPNVKRKILEEIANTTISSDTAFSGTKSFVYLHAALCETLRLYPPVQGEMKYAIEPDTLPSGHRVDSKVPIVFSIYVMARMRSIWGEDCLEFKPERWVSDSGTSVKREASYKFLTFNAGPRTCLGKNVSFMQMKMVAVEVMRRYEIEVVEGHPVEPCLAMILHMKHGLRVKVSKRK